MGTKATEDQLIEILRKHGHEFEARLDVGPVRLSLPVDERSPRIRVSVARGRAAKLPRSVRFRLDGRDVLVPLEVRVDDEEPTLGVMPRR
ncbi:MAG: hypothetical protein ACF8XB_19390 [Planctomycetota bacterium JB042]